MVANLLGRGLLAVGYSADVASDEPAGLARALATAYDVLVIEGGVAARGGHGMLRKLRRHGCRALAILLTDRQPTDAELAGEDLVCDVLVKPFAVPELVSRLHTLAHRPPVGIHAHPCPQGRAQAALAGDFQRLLDLSPYASVVLDEQGRVMGANRQAEPLFGCGQDAIIGESMAALLPEVSLGGQAQPTTDFLASLGANPQGGRCESTGLQRDGTRFAVEIDLTWLIGADGLFLLATFRDISSRKEGDEELRTSRQQLRELSARLLLLREEEGARISRTIHDDLGQSLTGLKMDLAWLKRHLRPDQADLLDKAKAMGELIDSTVQTVRRIATELRPGVLDELGLLPAIEWELQEFQRRSGVRCQLETTLTETALDTAGATAMFRIFQEALTNVARHAQANEVHVGVEEIASTLVLRVHDNGRGIRAGEIASAQSIGLLGMRERARLRGGDVRIQGSPGGGTTVTAWLPLDPGRGTR